MTTSDILRSTWRVLEAEGEHLPGLYERRVFAHSGYAVFARTGPTGSAAEAQHQRASDRRHRRTRTRDERVPGRSSVHRSGTKHTGLARTDPCARSGSCSKSWPRTSLARIVAAADDASAVAAMRERLNHWERFMSAAGPDGLGREKQIGLYGELTFLKTLSAPACRRRTPCRGGTGRVARIRTSRRATVRWR